VLGHGKVILKKMKIKIDSNFVIPGLEGENEILLDRPAITLRELLEELSLRSSGRVRFIRPSTEAVHSMDFTIEVNGLPNQGSREDLDLVLKEGDVVVIKVLPLGGG
jgi:hypothetical protein